ncbi:MAG: hypothetical protein MJ087_03335 [Lachnospiraceae bacterium]|nr:hypothetical protein [Lachnospiraceae bacterium]
MISEERVKLMTKMAIYEAGEGTKDLDLSQYHKKQYIRIEVLKSIVVSSVFFWMVVGLAMLLLMQYVVPLIAQKETNYYRFILIGLYILFIVINAMITYNRAQKDYDEAMPRVKEYKKNLNRLYFEYETKAKPEDTKPKDLKKKLEEELDAESI